MKDLVKTEYILPGVYIAAIIFGLVLVFKYVNDLIEKGRESLDLLGEDPAGIVGPDEMNMGPLSWFHFLTSGGKIDEYETAGGNVPWYVDAFDWNPLAGRWGLFG